MPNIVRFPKSAFVFRKSGINHCGSTHNAFRKAGCGHVTFPVHFFALKAGSIGRCCPMPGVRGSLAAPNATNDPVPITPGSNVHPTATRTVEVWVALAPTDSRTPWAPAPSTPLPAPAVIAAATIRFGAPRCEGSKADDKREGCDNFQ